MEPTVIETSIGLLCVQVEGRDWFTLQSPRPYGEVWPYVSLTLWRRDDSCELESKPWYDVEPGKEPMKKGPMPPALVEEFLKVGTEWANAHPEEFEKAARAEFDDHIFYIVHDTFDELIRIFTDAQNHFRKILDEPEFENYASTALRRRVKKEAQRLSVMRLQISGAAKAINTLASRRPSDPENQGAAQ